MKKVEESDAVSILEFFKDLPDPRCSINRKHLLGEIIVICICAVLCGADGPKAIGMWAQSKAEWLKRVLELPHGIPSHDTIGRVLAALKPAAFQACFANWIAQLQSAHVPPEAGEVKQVAIDGKALRRSHDKQKKLGPLFLVSAWSVECGLSLGQLATAEKSNEITAIPALLENLDVKGAIVTIDAAGCQKNIAQQIIDGGGHYVLSLKGNQKNIHKDVAVWMVEQMANDFRDVTARKLTVTEKSHGREVTYWYTQVLVPESLRGREQWAKLKTLGVAVRYCQQGDKDIYDTRYFLSSLPLGVQRFAKAVRGHWGIENTLHWCLDVTFREDESRLRDRIAGDNVAWLKRFALGLLKQVNNKESIAMRRRMAGWNEDFLAQVLTIPCT
jgi:predicted transposase YbfD/YdcC